MWQRSAGRRNRGSLAAKLLADVIAGFGNPLDDVTVLERVEFVMKGGEVFETPAAQMPKMVK